LLEFLLDFWVASPAELVLGNTNLNHKTVANGKIGSKVALLRY
jgi:hypothetical protein